MSKKPVSIVLTILMIYHTIGFYAAFHGLRYYVRHEVKQQIKRNIPDSELAILSFDPNSGDFLSIQWIDSHEFRFRGEMFDVIRTTVDDRGIRTYACIRDTQEERLMAALDGEVRSRLRDDATGLAHETKLILLSFRKEFCPVTFHFRPEIREREMFADPHGVHLLDPHSSPPSVPPWFPSI